MLIPSFQSPNCLYLRLIGTLDPARNKIVMLTCALIIIDVYKRQFLYCQNTDPDDDNKYCPNVNTKNVNIVSILTDRSSLNVPSLNFID